jgi:hypothetical protein
MQRTRILLGATLVVGLLTALAFTSFGGAAIHRVSALIAPTSKSAVADVNAYNNWSQGSTFSRDGFSLITSPYVGTYCLYGRADPDHSMLQLTLDAQHSNVAFPVTLMWDRSSPNCGPGGYEVYTYCLGTQPGGAPTQQAPVGRAPSPKAPEGPFCDDVAFFAQAYVRA